MSPRRPRRLDASTASTASTDHAATGAVERYLDQLFDLLAGTGRDGRRSLAEVEDHLREATSAGIATGLDRAAAETAAVTRVGPVESLAAGLRRSRSRASLTVVLRQLLGAAWLLGGAGALSIGLAGALVWPVVALFGPDYVAPDQPTQVLSAQRCHVLLAAYPRAGSCQLASITHHAEELVSNGIAMGVLGAIALLAFWFARGGGRLHRFAVTPPAGIVAAVGATAFALAASTQLESGAARLNSGSALGCRLGGGRRLGGPSGTTGLHRRAGARVAGAGGRPRVTSAPSGCHLAPQLDHCAETPHQGRRHAVFSHIDLRWGAQGVNRQTASAGRVSGPLGGRSPR